MGNVLATYQYSGNGSGSVTSGSWLEQDLYGSSRLGMLQPNWTIQAAQPLASDAYVTGTGNMDATIETPGHRLYELTNHLGNVLATVNDYPLSPGQGGNTGVGLQAQIMSSQDYYPFGMEMPGRTYIASGSLNYRYGFNGKENDNEVEGVGNSIDYGMRVYDPRVGRFADVDPITKKYPQLTPYQFASNRPIDGVDLDGAEYSTSGKFFSAPEGVWRVNTTVKINITNQSQIISNVQTIENIRSTIRNTIAKDQSGGVGTKDDPIVTTTVQETNNATIHIHLVDAHADRNGMVTTGYTYGVIGQSQTNTTDVAVTVDGRPRSLSDIGRTASHEQGHVAGLMHPFHGAAQTDMGATTGPLQTWRNNLMNSFGGSDTPGTPDYNGVKSVLGHVLTTQQRATITNTVQSQQPNGNANQTHENPQWTPPIR